MNIARLLSICEGMSEMAAKHPNDTISNALARVSRKIESIGSTKFAPKLDKTDISVINYYIAESKK